MKGDLHTLKRICEYASKVMLVGSVVIGVALAAFVVLAVCSGFSDSAADILRTLSGLDKPTNVRSVASVAVVIVILCMAMATVLTVYSVMSSIVREHSPFNERNTGSVIELSKMYLVCSVCLAILSLLSAAGIVQILFLLFGCILVGVVLYCFGLTVRYGAVLQDESDHTL